MFDFCALLGILNAAIALNPSLDSSVGFVQQYNKVNIACQAQQKEEKTEKELVKKDDKKK